MVCCIGGTCDDTSLLGECCLTEEGTSYLSNSTCQSNCTSSTTSTTTSTTTTTTTTSVSTTSTTITTTTTISCDTWTLETIDSTGTRGDYVSLEVINDTFAVSYVDSVTGALFYAERLFGTWSIELVDNVTISHFWTSLAKIKEQSAIASYRNGSFDDLYYHHRNASGWNTEMISGSGNAHGRYCSLEEVDGQPAVAFEVKGDRDLLYMRYDGSSWPTPSIIHDGGSTGDSEWGSLHVINGTPAVSFFDGGLMYSEWNGTAWDETMVKSGNSFGTHTALAELSTGHPAITYYDNSGKDIWFSWRTASGWTSEAAITTGNVGLWNDIVVYADDAIGVSYHEEGSDDLRYAEKSSGIWTSETVDSTNFVGEPTSIARTDSVVGIAYYDYQNTTLLFAYKGIGCP